MLKSTDWVAEYFHVVRTDTGGKVHLAPDQPVGSMIGRTLCGVPWSRKTRRPMRDKKWCSKCLASPEVELFL